MNIFICDDDNVFTNDFAELINKEFSHRQIEAEIHIFSTAYHLLKTFEKGESCDILFLDIDMPDTNGIDLADSIKKYTQSTYLIFVSTVESLVYQTFKVRPFWFIRKRFCQSELSDVITALLSDMQLHLNDSITLSCAHSIYTLHPRNICYIECQNKILHIHYEDSSQNISVPYTLSALEKQLTPYGFLRVHKGYLVNYHYIYTINRQDIKLDNGELIPVSKHRIQEIRQEYGRLLC